MTYASATAYRRLLWAHRPLTDFWRVGPGTARQLERHGLLTDGRIGHARPVRCTQPRTADPDSSRRTPPTKSPDWPPLYDRIVDRSLLVRRLNVEASQVHAVHDPGDVSGVSAAETEQPDLFSFLAQDEGGRRDESRTRNEEREISYPAKAANGMNWAARCSMAMGRCRLDWRCGMSMMSSYRWVGSMLMPHDLLSAGCVPHP